MWTKWKKSWPKILIGLLVATFMIASSDGASAQESGFKSAKGMCDGLCVSVEEWEQAERDAAKADRYDELRSLYQTCDAERAAEHGAGQAIKERVAACTAARLEDAAARARLDEELARARRQRWYFGGAGLVLGLATALAIASAF